MMNFRLRDLKKAYEKIFVVGFVFDFMKIYILFF